MIHAERSMQQCPRKGNKKFIKACQAFIRVLFIVPHNFCFDLFKENNQIPYTW